MGSKTADCLFIGYAQQSAVYRFLVLKSDILNQNTIIETKDAEFFENIFRLKVEHIPKSIENSSTSSTYVQEDSSGNLPK